MPRWRIWDRKNNEPAPAEQLEPAPPSVAPNARGFHAPPPRASAIPLSAEDGSTDSQARLRQRREAILFDVEQSESASRPDNPWRERIGLLDEALATVARDRTALAQRPIQPGIPLPPTPITDIDVTTEPVAAVRFSIASERFIYEEEIDWAERGTQLAQPVLQLISGDMSQLVPASFPVERRQELTVHLISSLFVFATDLRDRAIEHRERRPSTTLADLAKPCPNCGGWQDIHGTCAECERRNWERQRLDAEEERLRSERDREEQERARLADRLPIARRRLAELDAEIARLQA